VKTDEATQIRYVTERLITRHPDVDDRVIIEIVARVHQHFTGARVRDFVPLLVEKRANQKLARPAASTS
jgi:hypothetical protein